MSASLWQAFPQATAWQIHQAIEESSHLFSNPNDSLGYGIPDFEIARSILSTVLSVESEFVNTEFSIFPNPISTEALKIRPPEAYSFPLQIRLRSIQGSVINSWSFAESNDSQILELNLEQLGLSQGYYLVEIEEANGRIANSKLIKQ